MMEFLDKIYSNEKLFTMVYVVGAILLLIFVIMLIVSLKKPKTKKLNTKVLDKVSESKEEVKPEEKVELKEEESITPVENKEVETTIETNEEINEKPILDNVTTNIEEKVVEETKEEIKDENHAIEAENSISKALDNVENKNIINAEPEEEKISLSSEIPDVDEYVDKVVKKTYEKNEQFSSVFVGNNTSTIKLDKVLEDLNVDEDIKIDIVPDEEKTEIVEEEVIPVVTEEPSLMPEEIKEEKPVIDPDILEGRDTNKEEVDLTEEVKKDSLSSLDALKKAMEEKKKEVNSKQEELKSKLAGLKSEKKEDVMKAEDLLNKLNSMKSE